MLKKGINIILIFLVCYSCDNSKSKQELKVPVSVQADNYVKNNFPLYKELYKTINDSLNIYLDSLLNEYLFIYGSVWQLDSFVCINSANDKLVAIINTSSGIGEQAKSDAINSVLGKKIDGKWYFFGGIGTLVIPRKMYDKDSLHPLSFYELSQIGRKEMLEGLLMKNQKGELVVNDSLIYKHFYNNGYDTFTHHKVDGLVSPGEEYQMPRDKEKTDSVHWSLIMNKWKHKIDTNLYKPARRRGNVSLP